MGPSDRYMFMEVFIIFDGLDVYDSGNSQESASRLHGSSVATPEFLSFFWKRKLILK